MASLTIDGLTLRSTVDNSEDIEAPTGNTDYRMKPRTLASAQFPSAGSSLFLLPITQNIAAATQTLVVGSYYGNIFRARAGQTFDRLLVEVTSGPGADGNFRVGMYDYDFTTRLPVAGAPIYDSGNIAYTSAGFGASTTPRALTLGSGGIVIPASGVCVVVLQSDTAMTLRRGAGYTHGLTYLPVVSGANVLNNTAAPVGVTATGSFGAMPSSFSPALAASTGVPICALMKS